MAKYSFELKLKVVKAYLEGEGGYTYLAKKYLIKDWSNIMLWRNAYLEFGEEGLRRVSEKKQTEYEKTPGGVRITPRRSLKMFERRKKIYLLNGKTDMRKGIDGLVSAIMEQEDMKICDKEALFLFCGGKKDRYKALMWESDGFILSYKRIESGKLQWPKEKENRIDELNVQQLRWLLEGLSIVQPRAVEVAKVSHVI